VNAMETNNTVRKHTGVFRIEISQSFSVPADRMFDFQIKMKRFKICNLRMCNEMKFIESLESKESNQTQNKTNDSSNLE
jgi:hypothetical protein